jgi:hypothetical protein
MAKWLIAIVFASAGVAVAASQIPAAQAVIADPEAYAVYASLIPDQAPVAGAKAKRLVIQRETVTNNECTLSGAALETDWKPVVDDFKIQNAHVRFLLPDRDLRYPYLVVPRRDIMSLFTKTGGNWPEFYRRYPDSGGYIEVSAVGFDRAKTRAMVYMAHHCGGLCGGGTHHLLEKVEGAWRPANVPGISACMWIS